MTEFTRALREALAQAIREFTERGFDHPERLDQWMKKLHAASRRGLPDRTGLEKIASRSLEVQFKRSTEPATAGKRHPGVPRYTIERIRPDLRAQLWLRIQASADLIRMNHDDAVQTTLQRFAGWATSVPAGGSHAANRTDIKQEVSKSLKQMDFAQRRVLIDQGHKLMSSIDATIAQQTGAIAMMWRSHFRQPGYDARPDHAERDGKIYAIRGNWAIEKGLMNKGVGYVDEMTAPAEEPFCRCYGVYLNNLRDLPDSMLTAQGREALEEASRAKRSAQA